MTLGLSKPEDERFRSRRVFAEDKGKRLPKSSLGEPDAEAEERVRGKQRSCNIARKVRTDYDQKGEEGKSIVCNFRVKKM